jgi:EAL domain-containing protein (putative c-di-GMP-specific phosphodiesterase class I)/CheY-like chemotaxis protein
MYHNTLQELNSLPFAVDMPLAADASLVNTDQPADLHSPTSSPPRLIASSGTCRVLVVDDEPALRRSVIRLLGTLGYDVESAENGKTADAMFKRGGFDVVLSDIAMPDGDGIQLLRSLHDHDPDVPVVLITGEPAVSTAVKALEYGAFQYLTKPVDLKRLKEVVGKAVQLRRMALMKRQAASLLGLDHERGDLESLSDRFQAALDGLWMAYQPIVEADTGALFGYEALLRTDEPSFLHPGAVLDAAERLGQLDVLGRAIRNGASRPMAKAPPGTSLFVNIHPTDLLDPHLLAPNAPLSEIADKVVLEITERSSLDSVKDARQRVAQLRQMGYRIAVDDLGAGYAGLNSFALLEPDIVKLDMSLVRNVHQSSTRQKLIRSMTALCKDMGMLVVAEGIESVDEKDALVWLGCDLLQGYLLARPGEPFPRPSSDPYDLPSPSHK